jgi:hypothetical protein
MVNPKFATAVIMLLLVVAAVVLYSVFGTSLARMIQPEEAGQTANVAEVGATSTVVKVVHTVTMEAVATAIVVSDGEAEPTEAVPTEGQATEVLPTAVPPTEVPATKVPATRVPATKVAPTEVPDTATPESTETPAAVEGQYSRTVDGKYYDAYVDAATKLHQYYHYTCEFDAAWVVLKTNGIDATLQDQIDIVGLDTSIEPTYEETPDGFIVHGGDILDHYSGDYKENFLARSTGNVIRRIFEHYGLTTEAIHDRAGLEAALQRGELVWIKTTADFKPGKPVKWIMPDGRTYDTVLGNDHAAVVMGYSERGALIRDVLGPTSTNENRTYEYEVDWDTFMAAWGQQQYDGIAVGK